MQKVIGIFIGNGTAAHPNAGLLIGNGYSWTAQTSRPGQGLQRWSGRAATRQRWQRFWWWQWRLGRDGWQWWCQVRASTVRRAATGAGWSDLRRRGCRRWGGNSVSGAGGAGGSGGQRRVAGARRQGRRWRQGCQCDGWGQRRCGAQADCSPEPAVRAELVVPVRRKWNRRCGRQGRQWRISGGVGGLRRRGAVMEDRLG